VNIAYTINLRNLLDTFCLIFVETNRHHALTHLWLSHRPRLEPSAKLFPPESASFDSEDIDRLSADQESSIFQLLYCS
jgi:hypothetical protein